MINYNINHNLILIEVIMNYSSKLKNLKEMGEFLES